MSYLIQEVGAFYKLRSERMLPPVNLKICRKCLAKKMYDGGTKLQQTWNKIQCVYIFVCAYICTSGRKVCFFETSYNIWCVSMAFLRSPFSTWKKIFDKKNCYSPTQPWNHNSITIFLVKKQLQRKQISLKWSLQTINLK